MNMTDIAFIRIFHEVHNGQLASRPCSEMEGDFLAQERQPTAFQT